MFPLQPGVSEEISRAGEGPCPWQSWGHRVALPWWAIVLPADSASWLHRFSARVADCSPFPGSVLRLSLARCFGVVFRHSSQGSGVSCQTLCGYLSLTCGVWWPLGLAVMGWEVVPSISLGRAQLWLSGCTDILEQLPGVGWVAVGAGAAPWGAEHPPPFLLPPCPG